MTQQDRKDAIYYRLDQVRHALSLAESENRLKDVIEMQGRVDELELISEFLKWGYEVKSLKMTKVYLRVNGSLDFFITDRVLPFDIMVEAYSYFGSINIADIKKL